jgi:hypothetical protein
MILCIVLNLRSMLSGAPDIVSQWAIAILGPLSLVMVAHNNRWGFVVRLAIQLPFFVTAFVHAQYGSMVTALLFTFAALYAVLLHFSAFFRIQEAAFTEDVAAQVREQISHAPKASVITPHRTLLLRLFVPPISRCERCQHSGVTGIFCSRCGAVFNRLGTAA